MKNKVEADARELYQPMFSDRESIGAAFAYGYGVAERCGDAKVHVMTALHVLANTIAIRILEDAGRDYCCSCMHAGSKKCSCCSSGPNTKDFYEEA